MKIVKLQCENFKRLVAVEITPDGALVQITGKNGQGKSSVLDAVWAALGGLTAAPTQPIRRGQTQARIRLDLGELVVTRTFTKVGDTQMTSGITVTSATGARFNSPQTLLDEMLSHLTFDPLAFAHSKPREQYEALRAFVPGVDFDAIDKANERDFEERTVVNRKAREARVYAEQIQAPLNAPVERINEVAIVDELVAASSFNSDIARHEAAREGLANEAKQSILTAEEFERQADDLLKQASDLQHQASQRREHAKSISDRLARAEALPHPKDVASIQSRLEDAKTHNAAVALVEKKRGLISQAEGLERDSEVISKRMEEREAGKVAAIAQAKMPVPGIGFGKGFITLGDVPFEQASDAEQLRASVAIAMALNPTLKVIRVRDGSLLDSDNLKLLAELAEAQGYQIWLERVDDSGQVGFVMEDGHLRQTKEQEVANV